MSKIPEVFIMVYCILSSGKPYSGKFFDLRKAEEAFKSCKTKDLSCRISFVVDGTEVTHDAYQWEGDHYSAMLEEDWTNHAHKLLEAAGKLTKPQIDAVLAMDNKELRNAVATTNIEKICEIKGVAEKSAMRIIRALKKISKPQMVKLGKSREFPRMQLVNDQRSEAFVVWDTINKTVSPFEAIAMELGGKDAIIHVVSRIDDDDKDEGQMIRAAKLNDLWLKLVHEGIVYNGHKYKLFGHGTNAAKGCKSMAVLEEIYDPLRKIINAGCSKNWKNTAAKDVAYKTGLISVASHRIDIPFKPEMFCIYDTVVSTVKADTTKLYLDGHAEDIDNNNVDVKRSDGLFFIHVSAKMKVQLHNEMVLNGFAPEEASRILDDFCKDTRYYSYRGAQNPKTGFAPLKLKGLGVKAVDVHAYLKSIGVTKTPDGRDIDDIIFFVDDTVIKTNIGKGKAYETFKDWCSAMGDIFIGTLVQQHAKEKKHISYQVTQSLCEATDEQVEKIGQKTVDKLNNLHTVNGAARLLGREWGEVLKMIPELINTKVFDKQVQHAIENEVNEAFSGKVLNDCYYAFVCPEWFTILAKWHGVDVKPMLKAGQVHIPGVRKGKLGMWRSPVMHPNSVRVVENVDIPAEYKKFLLSDEYCIILNNMDDIPLAMDMDFDGDHGNVTDDDNIIAAIEETLAKWNRLIIWETPNPEKKIIDEKELTQYWEALTHMNELGLTVFGLNALLNGIIHEKDEITGFWYDRRIEVSHRGVDFKKFAANVLVDASKHGGANIDEPEESAMCANMLQPWSKTYQDAAFGDSGRGIKKKIWYVKYNKSKMFFETLDGARAYYNSIRYDVVEETGVKIDKFETDEKLAKSLCEPVNYLDELADPARLSTNLRYKTLNKLFAFYAENARRDTNVDDRPTGKLDYTKLMFDKTPGRRGMIGLIRKGQLSLVTLDGEKFRPDNGLIDSLARRYDRDRAAYNADDTIKDKDGNDFDMAWRANALAEIEAFASMYGKTLRDAYDVATWYMFTKSDNDYLRMDGKLDFLYNKLWQVYKLVFGGMALEAVTQNVGEEVCEGNCNLDIA